MAHINLLPWRERLRKKRQTQFGVLALMALVLTVVGMAYWGFFHVEGLIKQQNERNKFLQREIAVVNQEIAEISELEATRSRLIARMKVIEDLQVSRPQIVRLFDELVTAVPDGAYLTRMVQAGSNLKLSGRAQSNARVSAYMRNIESSPWMRDPKLRIIESRTQDRNVLAGSTFELDLVQAVPKEAGAR